MKNTLFASLWDDAYLMFKTKKLIEIEDIQHIKIIKIQKSKNDLYVRLLDGVREIKLRISFNLLNDENKKKIVKEIVKYHAVVNEILENNFPFKITEIIKKSKINLFQKEWNQKNLSCNCSEWLIPCSHTVALFEYLKRNKSDSPEYLFNLIGFDIAEEVRYQVKTNQVSNIKIPKIDFYLIENHEDKQLFYNYDLLKNIDFTVITDIKQTILSVLERNPVFHYTDFHSILYSAYQDISIGTKFYINNFFSKEIDGETKNFLNSIKRIEIAMDYNINFKSIFYYNQKNERIENQKTDLFSLIKTLEGISEKRLLNYSPYIIALYYIYLFSIELLNNSAYFPQLFLVKNNEYRMRWIPKVLNQEVNQVYNILQQIVPSDILYFYNEKTNNKKYLKIKELTETLSSLFLEYFVSKYIDQIINLRKIEKNDKIFNLFFKNEAINFSRDSEKTSPLLIYDWLKKFYITQKKYFPSIKVQEANNKYNVEFYIYDRENQKEISISEVFNNDFSDMQKEEIESDLYFLADYFPDLMSFIESKGVRQLILDSEQFVKFLLDTVPVFRLFGINTILPEALNHLVRPQITIHLKTKNNRKVDKYLDLEKLLDYNWKIAIGNTFLDEKEFAELIQNVSGIVKYNEMFVHIKREDATKLIQQLSNKQAITSYELAKAALSGEYKEAKVSVTINVRKIIDNIKDTSNYELPKNLNAELRPYQVKGYEWLLKNTKFGLGSLIADDMGLGKTVQVLSALLKIKEETNFNSKKILVIVPTTLLTNWRKEVDKFTPELKTTTYYGSSRKLNTEDADIIFTSYGTLRNDVKTLKEINWFAVVIDEAQNIKNSRTDQAITVKQLQSEVRIAMSGTPVENRLTEYWSILDFLNKGIFGTQKQFVEEFATPIQLYRSKAKLEKFKKITQPFILRRLKSDKSIINDLPDKVESNQYCSLATKQAAMYQKLVNETIFQVNNKLPDERKGLVLQMITGLKQICNHPYHFSKEEDMDFENSGKVTMLFNLLETIYENNEKVLIFTQYKQMGDILVQLIEKHFQTNVLFLHGSLSRKERDEMIDKFQTDSSFQTFVLSLKAGGLGLNLTEASNVIHFDLWWNPASEAQATDRAYRIGQTKNVMVYRLICKGTFEEKIDEMLSNKKQLAEMTVVTGDKWVGDLSEKEIRGIFELR